MSNDIYIVYETTNTINGKYYIGVHKVNGSNYLGSGKILKRSIKKHGISNFIRETLKSFNNKEDAYQFESLIVTDNLVNHPHCYNLKKGGFGGWSHIDSKNKIVSKLTRKKQSNARKGQHTGKKNNHQYGIIGSKNHNSKTYKITFPDGHTEVIKDINNFCMVNNLHAGCMCAISKGKRHQHKGFKCQLLNQYQI